jgi:Kdo2-lipid IVA lauroyltransferase/acyltransferase
MPSFAYSALRSASGLAHHISIEQVSFIGSVLARRMALGSKRNARALANLKVAFPEFNEAERQAIVSNMWDNFGRTLAEILVLDRIAEAHSRITIANPELLSRLRFEERGIVFAGLHFGNWEVISIALAQQGINPVGVYKPIKDRDISNWLERQRSRYCAAGLYPTSRGTVLRLAKHVRAGGAIGIAADYRDPSGLYVPFFGRPAPSTVLPAKLAVRYNARLIVVRVDRLPRANFSVFLEEVPILQTKYAEANIQNATAELQAVFESWIRSDPAMWRWHYKRWDVDPLARDRKLDIGRM